MSGKTDPAAPDATTWTSLFDLFRIGIGSSSSHTVGPMLAAGRFLAVCNQAPEADRLQVDLFGSSALTGRGHATETAAMLGLLGEAPDRVDPNAVPALVAGLRSRGAVQLPGGRAVAFNPDVDLVFRRRETLPSHPNALPIALLYDGSTVLERTYYSVDGGFVVEAGVAAAPESGPAAPHGFTTAAEMLDEGARTKLTIAELQRSNERTRRSDKDISAGIQAIWTAMRDCVQRGLRHGGDLPGGLRVRRRAPGLHARLLDASSNVDPLRGMDWVNMWALAVNEENASGGRVVTAPWGISEKRELLCRWLNRMNRLKGRICRWQHAAERGKAIFQVGGSRQLASSCRTSGCHGARQSFRVCSTGSRWPVERSSRRSSWVLIQTWRCCFPASAL